MNKLFRFSKPGRRISSFRSWILSASPAVSLTTLALLCALSVGAHAQQPSARSDWGRVKALSPGIVVDVKSATMHMHCKLTGVSDEGLTCTHGAAATSEVFQRATIVWIKTGRRGRSALIGAGIGGAALGTIGFAAASSQGDGFFGPNFERGAVTGVGAVAGVVIGAGIGALTDFSRTTIYRAP